MKHRLIIVEGLPCTGKSSLSQFIAETLSNKEYKVSHYDEGMVGHPADYEFHAFMTEDDFMGLANEEIAEIKERVSVKKQ